MRRSEDTLQESSLSFHLLGPGDQTQVVIMTASAFPCWALSLVVTSGSSCGLSGSELRFSSFLILSHLLCPPAYFFLCF